MKDGIQKKMLSDRIAGHPLIQALSDMAEELCHLQFMVVFPGNEGWHQIRPAGSKALPGYCGLIQSSKDGAKHCRMCHVLMSVAACREDRYEEQCHAGGRVLAAISQNHEGARLAVLSSCIFHSSSALAVVRSRARKLGLDVRQMEKAFRALPKLTPQDQEVVRQILRACAEAAVVVRHADQQAAQIKRLEGHVPPPSPIAAALKAGLRDVVPVSSDEKTNPTDTPSPPPMLIRVLRQLVDEHPELPFTEKDIAAAARTTPNYLSALFRRHVGQCFSDYVGEQRLFLAKNLLRDLTLSIGEVSRKAGYDDPGYFARRFRQKTGLSPRAWRHRRLTPRK